MNWFKRATSKEKDLGMKRDYSGIIVNVENPAGTIRMGIGHGGKEWRTEMKYDYGFIYALKGADDEGLDVYLGPNQKASTVYIVHQVNPKTGAYDEDKCMLGFDSDEDAKKAYLEHYDSPDYFGAMSKMSFEAFKNMIDDKKRGKVNWKKKVKPV